MEQSSRPRPVAPILIVLGIVGSLTGAMILMSRVWLAARVLGANFVFGMTWNSVDSMKVSLVAFQGLWLVFLGGGLFVAGLILYTAPLRHNALPAPVTQPQQGV